MRTLARHTTCPLILLALGCQLLVGSTKAQAQDCSLRHRFRVPDGQITCLTDFTLADAIAPSRSLPVRDAVPRKGFYSLAASTPGDACPLVVGLAVSNAVINSTISQFDDPKRRQNDALKDCRAQISTATSAGAACECEVLIHDDASRLTLEQLKTRYKRSEAAK